MNISPETSVTDNEFCNKDRIIDQKISAEQKFLILVEC